MCFLLGRKAFTPNTMTKHLKWARVSMTRKRSQTHFTSPCWRPSRCLAPCCQVLSICSRGKHNENASPVVHCTDGPITGTSLESRCPFILSQFKQKIWFSVAHQRLSIYSNIFHLRLCTGRTIQGKKTGETAVKRWETASWETSMVTNWWWTVSVGQFVQFSCLQTSGSVSYWLQNDLKPWAYPSCPIHPADIYNLQDFGRGFSVSWGAGSVHTGLLWHSWNIYLWHHVGRL